MPFYWPVNDVTIAGNTSHQRHLQKTACTGNKGKGSAYAANLEGRQYDKEQSKKRAYTVMFIHY